MKLIAAILLSAIALHAQFGNARSLQSRPLAATAPSDTNVICWDASGTTWKPCTASSSSGTVTSIGLVGTANQITVTGASPITTSGSWTLSFPTNVTLPGTTSGTFSGNLTGTASTATNALSLGGNLANTYAPLASPTFTGTIGGPGGFSLDSSGLAVATKLGNAAFSLLTGAGKFSSGVPVGQAACADLSDAGSGCSATAGANAALSNLASVSINTSLLAQTGVDLGSTAKPFRDLYLFGSGTFATTYLKITGTPTSTRTWTLPDASDTFAGLGISQTFSGNNIFSANGALSSGAGPGAKFNGTWITGGTGTTTKPYVLIETTGATSTGWNTSGTGLGINAATGFGGMLVDLKVNGSSTLNIDSTGKLVSIAALQGNQVTGTTNGVISSRTDNNAFSARGTAGGFALDTANPTGGYCFNGAVQFTQDTCLHRNAAAVVEFNGGTKGTITGGIKLREIEVAGTVPGISGCSAGTQTGGGSAGTYTSGTTGTCTVTLTFAKTAATGWSCFAANRTTAADIITQTSSTTTTAVLAGASLSGDVISYGCVAY